MARNNDGFNLDDMMEIFGDAIPVAAPRAAAPAPVAAPPSAPTPAPVPGEDLTADEQALLRAYEQRKQQERLRREEEAREQALREIRGREERRIIEEFENEQRSRPAPPVERPLADVEAAENEAFCAMIEETRSVMFAFLAPLTGIKAANNMLNKSVEKARDKAPVMLKDANWRMDGTLREDGSVDPERLLKNASGLPAATRLDDYLAGLRALVALRLRAVEAGLGAGACADMKARLLESRAGLVQRPIPAAWVDAFYSRVLG